MWRLAWRYLQFHRFSTTVLVAAITVAAFLPLATQLLWWELQRGLRSRADQTPLLLGARGSRFDLTLHALYFEASPPGTITMGDLERVESTGWGVAIPLDARFRAADTPLVGTSLDYFNHRKLRLARGNDMARLGDCVIGSQVARTLGIGPGDHLLTDTESFVDIMQYPVRLRVTGVLAPAGTVDDAAIFCDIKTIWVIEGIGHGHEDLARSKQPEGVVLQRNDREIVAGAALKRYYEITDENIGSFHFHGDPQTFPLAASIIVPRDRRAATLLLARFQQPDNALQLVEPPVVIEQLLQTVVRIKRWLDLAALLVACSTALLIGLVVLLSLRLRRQEFVTLHKLGCRRRTTVWLVTTQLLLVGAACAALLMPFGLFAWAYGPDLLRQWVTRG